MQGKSFDDFKREIADVKGSPTKPADPEENLEVDKPDPANYRAFGHSRTKFLTSLHVYLNAEGRRKYGRRKFQFQYVGLESDDPECGFADDGTWFAILFSGSVRQRLIVRGRNLETGWDLLTFHRLPWLRAADRDFGTDDNEPFISSIDIVPVEESE